MRRTAFILSVLVLAIIVGAIVLNGNTSALNNRYSSNLSKSSHVLTYEIRSYGSISDHVKSYIFTNIVNKIIGEYRDVLANYSLKPKYYVVMYKNYSLYMETWKKLSHSQSVVNDIELLQSYSCKILASRIQVFITPINIFENNTLEVNITLVFNNGLAVCGEKYSPLPISDSKWIRKEKNYITLFNTLNITRTVYIDGSNGAVTNSDGEFIGEWVFQLSMSDLGRNTTLILYNIDTNTLTSIGNKTYPLANLVYVYKYQNSYISKPIIITTNNETKKVEGIILVETTTSPIPENLINTLKQRKIYNMPPFIQYYKYLRENNTLIKPYIETAKIPIQKYKPWTNILRIEKITSKKELGDKKISMERIIYGIKINNEYYIASINLGIMNITYNEQGELINAKIKLYGGNLYSALPSVINELFGIGYESMTNSSIIEISLVNEK